MTQPRMLKGPWLECTCTPSKHVRLAGNHVSCRGRHIPGCLWWALGDYHSSLPHQAASLCSTRDVSGSQELLSCWQDLGPGYVDSRSLHSLETFTCAGNSYSTFNILCMPALHLKSCPFQHLRPMPPEQHIHSFHGYLNGAALASVQPCPQKAPSRADMWQVQLKGPLHLNHFLQLLIIMLVLWPLKGICSNQHDIDHDPTGPYVSNLHRHTQSCSCPEAALNRQPIAPSLYFRPLEQCINMRQIAHSE